MLRTDYAHIPQRGGNVTPLGSNIAAARCGWEIGIGEQWQRDVSASPQHDKIPLSLRASNRVGCSETLDCFANARNDIGGATSVALGARFSFMCD
ncbi:MAG: hypothetical protein K2N54_09025 [Helicobacter sp.]|nr:hypothetical protein [Helicobacter sp.]